VSVRIIVPVSVSCPQCQASATSIRAWRASAEIFYLCGLCDAAWTVGVEPGEQANDVLSKLKRLLS
jgi:hypothetical protein